MAFEDLEEGGLTVQERSSFGRHTRGGWTMLTNFTFGIRRRPLPRRPAECTGLAADTLAEDHSRTP